MAELLLSGRSSTRGPTGTTGDDKGWPTTPPGSLPSFPHRLSLSPFPPRPGAFAAAPPHRRGHWTLHGQPSRPGGPTSTSTMASPLGLSREVLPHRIHPLLPRRPPPSNSSASVRPRARRLLHSNHGEPQRFSPLSPIHFRPRSRARRHGRDASPPAMALPWPGHPKLVPEHMGELLTSLGTQPSH